MGSLEMTREEAIARLCALMARVNGELTGWTEATDCICHCHPDDDYRNEGTALAFIETAVLKALSKRKKS